MLREVSSGLPNVEITAFDGLVVDFCEKTGAGVIVRGIRSGADFDYELVMAQTNRKLNPRVDTFFLTTSPEYSFVSSSSVRELLAFHGDITAFVPDQIRLRIYNKIMEDKNER